jgi:hypothetical protein
MIPSDLLDALPADNAACWHFSDLTGWADDVR